MPNPLFSALGGNHHTSIPDFGQFVQQFQQFKANFHGDARQQVQNLLNTGQMTQQQYNELQNVARQFMSVMPK